MAEADFSLIRRARDGDELAAARLLRRYEPLIRGVASEWFAPGLDVDDLRQEGRVGFNRAVHDYNPAKGVAFGAFAKLCVRRQVITAVKAATRGKHAPLSSSVRVVVGEDDEADALELLGVDDRGPDAILIDREWLAEIARALREKLSDTECACIVGRLNGMTFEEIGARWGLDNKTIDNALIRARVKLFGHGPRSMAYMRNGRRAGAHGYTCPGCGGPTVKANRGRGRPPRCVVCRVGAAA